MYLLLEPSEAFANLHGMLPAILPDIETEIYVLFFKSIWFKAIKSPVHVYSKFCALN